MVTGRLGNAYLGEMGERIVRAFAGSILGETVVAVGVGKGGRESVDLVGPTVAVEVKTVRAGVEEKVRGAAKAYRQKRAWAQTHGLAEVTVLVVLDPVRWEATIYRAFGFGQYRSGGMAPCGTFAVRGVLTSHAEETT